MSSRPRPSCLGWNRSDWSGIVRAYTDGNAFSLWQEGELVSLVRLDGDVETSGAKLAAPAALLPLVDSFLDPGEQIAGAASSGEGHD